MEKERLIWADSLKGWLILLVILGHAIQSTLGKWCFDNHLWNFIYSFHMPAFIAVSRWFEISMGIPFSCLVFVSMVLEYALSTKLDAGSSCLSVINAAIYIQRCNSNNCYTSYIHYCTNSIG